MARTRTDELLLGEWACLGILAQAPAHGFAVAARLKPEGDIGRIWSVSRALTYRALDELVARGLAEPHVTERGIAGGNRTVFRITRRGRTTLHTWLAAPVAHLRDLRSELLLKITLAAETGIDIAPMLREQRQRIERMVAAMTEPGDAEGDGTIDVIALWRVESARAALQFLDRLPG